jgi:hydroxyethylthiazole kinase-like uncharacterized protein yjeF
MNISGDIKKYIKSLYIPGKTSHKGQNGKLLIIGGSTLFHSASLWALEVASRIVDLVHYCSTDENNRIVEKLKEEFRDGIVVSRLHIEDYIKEDDVILIGPGMVREENVEFKTQISKPNLKTQSLNEILKMQNEGEQTYYLTKYLLKKYPEKKWVIDAGALQMMEPEWIPKNAILTPHKHEFIRLVSKFSISNSQFSMNDKNHEFSISKMREVAKIIAEKYHCTILLKGERDYIEDEYKCEEISGGNAGMTKGGTGDVLAGLVAALYCKNEAFVSAVCTSYINKKAGEDLFEKKGYWYNASDLADQLPETMKKIFL